MGKLHLIGGEKGGVGKSFTSRLLAQYHIDHYQGFLGFDTDISHATFSRFYGAFANPLDVDSFVSLDKLIEAAEKHSDQDLLVDLAAQTAHKLYKWIDEAEVFNIMDELHRTTYYWHVMDDGADSVHLLKKLLVRMTGSSVNLVVVQNHGRGKNFHDFEHSSTYQLACEYGAKFIAMPNLEEQLTRKIDFNDLSFWAAANDQKIMTTVERQRMKVWTKLSYQQVAKVLADNSE